MVWKLAMSLCEFGFSKVWDCTLAPNLRRSLTMSGLGWSLEPTYSARTGRKGGPSSLSMTRFGLAPADSRRLISSTLLGTLSATATCSGLPMIGELELTFAPAITDQSVQHLQIPKYKKKVCDKIIWVVAYFQDRSQTPSPWPPNPSGMSWKSSTRFATMASVWRFWTPIVRPEMRLWLHRWSSELEVSSPPPSTSSLMSPRGSQSALLCTTCCTWPSRKPRHKQSTTPVASLILLTTPSQLNQLLRHFNQILTK